MMTKAFLFVLLFLSAITSCFGQSNPPDSQTLQSILAELRSMHSEVRTQAARTQTMQILLIELQMQGEDLQQANNRVITANGRLNDGQESIGHITAEITRTEDALNTASTDAEKARIAMEIDRLKTDLTVVQRSQQARLSDQQQAQAQLQKAQISYDSIQDELSNLMKTLKAEEQPGSK